MTAIQAPVQIKQGKHCDFCDADFSYHFTDENGCGKDFCPGCYKPAPEHAGAVRCPCGTLVYFGSKYGAEMGN
jgi:hypothetical protein